MVLTRLINVELREDIYDRCAALLAPLTDWLLGPVTESGRAVTGMGLTVCSTFQYQGVVFVLGAVEKKLKEVGISDRDLRDFRLTIRCWEVNPMFNREGLIGMGGGGVYVIEWDKGYKEVSYQLMMEVAEGVNMELVREGGYRLLRS